MSTRLLTAADLPVGQPLPWPVYDAAGRLLLGAGQLVKDEQFVDALVAREAYRPLSADELRAANAPAQTRVIRDPFVEMTTQTARLAEGLTALMTGRQQGAVAWAADLVDAVESLVTMDDNAVLGALLLHDDLGYSVAHAWMSATLCDIVARRLPLEDAERRSLIAAALTSNVGMFDIQDTLSEQAGPLDPRQARAVHAHPGRSVALLEAAGIDDPLWLRTTREHHERLDGSGYPQGLKGDAIALPARLLALADIYAAMILPRRYRDGIHAKSALREIFTQRGEKVDAALVGTFIKEVGVFPPGVFVRLQCGEMAVVIRRNPMQAQKPIVRSVRNALGRQLERPLLRDSAEATPYAIVEALPRQPLPFTLREVWGYR